MTNSKKEYNVAGWSLTYDEQTQTGKSFPPKNATGYCITEYSEMTYKEVMTDFIKLVSHYIKSK